MPEIDLHQTMDAAIWAKEFCRIADNLGHKNIDEGWMVGWFANAIMVGYDRGRGVSPTILPDGSAFIVE